MKKHIQIMLDLLLKNDNEGLLKYYQTSEESENIAQLAYLFHQGMSDNTKFDIFQQLATKLVASKHLPVALIAQIKTSDTLSFFTLALQLQDNFKKIDHLQRNALHYLLSGNQLEEGRPPFNYLRSMMLFGSNETLRDALCQRDCEDLTPIEVYLFSNQNFTTLPPHELTALLALIEIESKQQNVDTTNYMKIIQGVSKLGDRQKVVMNSELQRLILIAIYFSKPIKEIVSNVTKYKTSYINS
jgi:hypothetical protein